MIALNGADSVNIHTVPMSPYWIVMYRTEKTFPNFKVIVCNPELTKYRLVSDTVSPESYLDLWSTLTKIELSPRLTEMCGELKKCASNYNKNKFKNICQQTSQATQISTQQHERLHEIS